MAPPLRRSTWETATDFRAAGDQHRPPGEGAENQGGGAAHRVCKPPLLLLWPEGAYLATALCQSGNHHGACLSLGKKVAVV